MLVVLMLLAIFVAIAASACLADDVVPKGADIHSAIVYTLDWKELNRIADVNRFKIEERGMGIYVFTRDKISFQLSMHTDPDTGNADSPLVLTCLPKGARETIKDELDVSRGVERTRVERFFRRFAKRAIESQL